MTQSALAADTQAMAQREQSARQENLAFHTRHLLFLLVEKLCDDREASKLAPAAPVSMLPVEWAKVYGKDLNMLLQKCGFSSLEAALQTVAGLHVATDGPERVVMLAPPSLQPLEKRSNTAMQHMSSPTASTDAASCYSFASSGTEIEEEATIKAGKSSSSLVEAKPTPRAKGAPQVWTSPTMGAQAAAIPSLVPLPGFEEPAVTTDHVQRLMMQSSLAVPQAKQVGVSKTGQNIEPHPVAMMQQQAGTWRMVLVA